MRQVETICNSFEPYFIIAYPVSFIFKNTATFSLQMNPSEYFQKEKSIAAKLMFIIY